MNTHSGGGAPGRRGGFSKAMTIDARGLPYRELNEKIRAAAGEDILVEGCNGQRYLGAGLARGRLEIRGTPGNALGAYLDGGEILVRGNAQEAAGDTMNAGRIVVHGSCGDGLGYGMRGGLILVRDDVGYRAGIHMKSYGDRVPAVVIGGGAGSFLGEYQAGGLILVLGRGREGKLPVGRFCGTGMHGGKILLRTDSLPFDLPEQVSAREAGPEDLAEFRPYGEAYAEAFGVPLEELFRGRFYLLTPNTSSPYRQLYTNQ